MADGEQEKGAIPKTSTKSQEVRRQETPDGGHNQRGNTNPNMGEPPKRLSVDDEKELMKHFAHLTIVETDSMETQKYKKDQAQLIIQKEIMRRELEDVKRQNRQYMEAMRLPQQLPPQQQQQPQVPQPGGPNGQPGNLPPPGAVYQYSREGRRSRNPSGVRMQEPQDPLPYGAEALQGAHGLNYVFDQRHDAANCPSRIAPMLAQEALQAPMNEQLYHNNNLVRAQAGQRINRPNVIVPPVLPHNPNPMEPITRSSGTHSNIAIMSRDVTQNIYMANPQEEQLNVQRQLIEQEQEHLNMIGQLFQMQTDYQNAQRNNQPVDQRALDQVIDRLRVQMEARRQQADGKARQIKQAENLANVYTSKLEVPPLAQNNAHYNAFIYSKLQAHNVGMAMKRFNRDKDPQADFADTWNQILNYTKDFLLTEQSYFEILLSLVEGSAFKVANDMVRHGFTLADVLDNMEMQFCKKKTINDYIDDINNFERMQDEDIGSTMSRAQITVQKICKHYPSSEWESNKERILNSILGQVITANTRANLEVEEAKHSRIGTKMSYKAKLDHVENHEKAYDEKPMHAVKTVINACTGLPNVKRVDSTQQMLKRLETLEKQQKAIALNVSHPRVQRPRSSSRPRSSNREVVAHDYAVEHLLAEKTGTQLPEDDWERKEKNSRGTTASRPSYRLGSRSRSRDPYRHSSASKRPIQRERSRQRSFSRDRNFNRENKAPGYERSRSRGRSMDRRTTQAQPTQQPQQPVQQVQHVQHVQPPVQIYNPDSQLFPQHTQNNQLAYPPHVIMSDLSNQAVAPVTHQSNVSVLPATQQGWTPAQYVVHPSQVPWNYNQGYPNQGNRGRGNFKKRGGRQNNNNNYQNYRGRSSSRGYDGRGRQRSSSRNRGQWSNQSGSSNKNWRGRSPSVDKSRALEYHGNSDPRGQAVSYNRGHPSPQRPHISYENGGRRFTYDDGQLQLTYCNEGCVNKFHPTEKCPYKNKPLN